MPYPRASQKQDAGQHRVHHTSQTEQVLNARNRLAGEGTRRFLTQHRQMGGTTGGLFIRVFWLVERGLHEACHLRDPPVMQAEAALPTRFGTFKISVFEVDGSPGEVAALI